MIYVGDMFLQKAICIGGREVPFHDGGRIGVGSIFCLDSQAGEEVTFA